MKKVRIVGLFKESLIKKFYIKIRRIKVVTINKTPKQNDFCSLKHLSDLLTYKNVFNLQYNLQQNLRG